MRRSLLPAVVLVLLISASACGDDGSGAVAASNSTSTTATTTDAPAPAGDETLVIEHDGVERTAIVHTPALTGDEPVPLVLVLHGKGGTGADAQRRYGWDPTADAEGFVVAYPDGTDRQWNLLPNAGPDDVGFLLALLDELEATYPTAPDRVYVAGMSNGAFMSYRLACVASDRIAAIGPVAGSSGADCPDAEPVSVLHLHGLDDGIVPFAGGPGLRGIEMPPVEAALERWAAIDGCEPEPERHRDGALAGRTWTGCDDGTAVELVTIDGAGHQWPGGEPSIRPDADPPSDEVDATARLWTFFAAHPRA